MVASIQGSNSGKAIPRACRQVSKSQTAQEHSTYCRSPRLRFQRRNCSGLQAKEPWTFLLQRLLLKHSNDIDNDNNSPPFCNKNSNNSNNTRIVNIVKTSCFIKGASRLCRASCWFSHICLFDYYSTSSVQPFQRISNSKYNMSKTSVDHEHGGTLLPNVTTACDG